MSMVDSAQPRGFSSLVSTALESWLLTRSLTLASVFHLIANKGDAGKSMQI